METDAGNLTEDMVYRKMVNDKDVKIYGKYDKTYDSMRYSFEIDNNIGNGGYGNNNEILFTTIDSAYYEALTYFLTKSEIRNIKIDELLNN